MSHGTTPKRRCCHERAQCKVGKVHKLWQSAQTVAKILLIRVRPTLCQPLSPRNTRPAEVKRVSSRGEACTQPCSLLLTLLIGLSGCVRAAKPLFIVSVKVRVGKDMSEIPMCHVHTAPLVLLSHCPERHKRQTSLLSPCKCSLVIFTPVLSGEHKGRTRDCSPGRQHSSGSLLCQECRIKIFAFHLPRLAHPNLWLGSGPGSPHWTAWEQGTRARTLGSALDTPLPSSPWAWLVYPTTLAASH